MNTVKLWLPHSTFKAYVDNGKIPDVYYFENQNGLVSGPMVEVTISIEEFKMWKRNFGTKQLLND